MVLDRIHMQRTPSAQADGARMHFLSALPGINWLAVPVTAPEKGLWVKRTRAERMAPPARARSPSVMMIMPRRKRPSPPATVNEVRNVSIRHLAGLSVALEIHNSRKVRIIKRNGSQGSRLPIAILTCRSRSSPRV